MRNHKDPARQEQLLSYSDSGAHGCAVATTKRISKRYNCAQGHDPNARPQCTTKVRYTRGDCRGRLQGTTSSEKVAWYSAIVDARSVIAQPLLPITRATPRHSAVAGLTRLGLRARLGSVPAGWR